MNSNRLTLVVPNFNTGKLWLRTLRGIEINKNKIDFVIIVDAFSSDSSAVDFEAALKKLKINTHTIKRKPAGIIDAINHGVGCVDSDYVLVNLCGDELIKLPEICFDRNEIVYGECQIHSVDGIHVGSFVEKFPKVSRYRMPHINMNSIIWPASFIKNSISITKLYKISSDHALILEAINQGLSFRFNQCLSSIFYKDGISSEAKMHAFGLGESFYITTTYGNKLMTVVYAIYSIVFRRIRLLDFIDGYKYAKGLNV